MAYLKKYVHMVMSVNFDYALTYTPVSLVCVACTDLSHRYKICFHLFSSSHVILHLFPPKFTKRVGSKIRKK